MNTSCAENVRRLGEIGAPQTASELAEVILVRLTEIEDRASKIDFLARTILDFYSLNEKAMFAKMRGEK
jgi:hypothetical protein